MSEKHRRRDRTRRLRGLIRSVPAACATADAGRGEKRLSRGRIQAIFTSVGRPLGECRLKRKRKVAFVHRDESLVSGWNGVMKEYVLRYFSWLASQRFRLAMLLGLTLPTILLADSLTPASACSMACRSYEVEAAASDLVFLGQVEDVRVENGSSGATVRPLRWIKGSTQLPIVATAPLRRTRDEREFGCPGPSVVHEFDCSCFSC